MDNRVASTISDKLLKNNERRIASARPNVFIKKQQTLGLKIENMPLKNTDRTKSPSPKTKR